jgi:hypothetical protein
VAAPRGGGAGVNLRGDTAVAAPAPAVARAGGLGAPCGGGVAGGGEVGGADEVGGGGEVGGAGVATGGGIEASGVDCAPLMAGVLASGQPAETVDLRERTRVSSGLSGAGIGAAEVSTSRALGVNCGGGGSAIDVECDSSRGNNHYDDNTLVDWVDRVGRFDTHSLSV